MEDEKITQGTGLLLDERSPVGQEDGARRSSALKRICARTVLPLALGSADPVLSLIPIAGGRT